MVLSIYYLYTLYFIGAASVLNNDENEKPWIQSMNSTKITRGALIFLVTSLLLILVGCGGGGGNAPSSPSGSSFGGSGGSDNTGATGSTSLTIAEVNGTVGSLLNPSSSILKSRSSVSRSFSILDKSSSLPLNGVQVEMCATSIDDLNGDGKPDESGTRRPYLKLGDALSNSRGEYSIKILSKNVSSLGLLSKTTNIVSLASLYTSTHLVTLKIKRSNSVDSQIDFHPAYNQKVLGGDEDSLNLRINATIDEAKKGVKLEVFSEKELNDWDERLENFRESYRVNPESFQWDPTAVVREELSERLVIQSIDQDKDGSLDPTPVTVFDRPEIGANFQPNIALNSENVGKIVRIFEIDGDGDSFFGGGEDNVSGEFFGGDVNSPPIASGIDLFSEGILTDKAEVANFDTRAPNIRFVSPEPQFPATQVSGDLKIEVRFSDETAYNLKTLKITSDEEIEFLRPGRFTLKPNIDFAQDYFLKKSDFETGEGVATFTLQNVLFAFGPRSHRLFARIEDFAGNESKTEVSFVVNAAPEFASDTPRSLTVSEGLSLFTTVIKIFDVDPMDIVLSSPSGAVLPDIFLSTSAEDSSVKTDKLYQLEPQSQASTSFVTFALNIDRKSTRLNSSHSQQSRMPSSA